MNNRKCAQCHEPIAEDGDCYCKDCGDEILRKLEVHIYYGDGYVDRRTNEKYAEMIRQIILAAYKRMVESEKAKWN